MLSVHLWRSFFFCLNIWFWLRPWLWAQRTSEVHFSHCMFCYSAKSFEKCNQFQFQGSIDISNVEKRKQSNKWMTISISVSRPPKLEFLYWNWKWSIQSSLRSRNSLSMRTIPPHCNRNKTNTNQIQMRIYCNVGKNWKIFRFPLAKLRMTEKDRWCVCVCVRDWNFRRKSNCPFDFYLSNIPPNASAAASDPEPCSAFFNWFKWPWVIWEWADERLYIAHTQSHKHTHTHTHQTRKKENFCSIEMKCEYSENNNGRRSSQFGMVSIRCAH